jgi:hypothetical protein
MSGWNPTDDAARVWKHAPAFVIIGHSTLAIIKLVILHWPLAIIKLAIKNWSFYIGHWPLKIGLIFAQ